MASDLNLMRDIWAQSLLIVGGLCLSGPSLSAAEQSETYTWSAELVAFDHAAQAVTLRARVEQHAEIEDFGDFSAGDRVTLTWTGKSWGAGIRDIEPGLATTTEWLTLPAEFVASESDGRYVTFRVEIPSEAVERIATLSPGQWITASTPRDVSDFSEAVAMIRPYNDDVS